ncbi:GDSL-like Lipase/Acylhydrolase [Magnetospirillum gryphiswaldense MSR-1 v2]|uniref:GDSL-like Lipase/Acylhydrolase n=1 Tax=Magnetospirillum gryphiswaldense (strain DSM 6361 / JCM 21280 / NBRC 15271 / MSR-1) TaxID=431944 RepID=V6F8X5_MAGGM|nr:GDSL-type esterase/lipase family protein [Magnetospirillum gryphiswaldense]CDL01323.1 GDSL-like Lipase/Acylhydrolase [Magnetospirillum gryphiswaldense MSR-1 v2]
MPAALRLCFFGDSFINGTGDPTGLGWVGRACASQRTASPDLTVYNLGIRGDKTAQIHRRWQVEAQARLDGIAPAQRRLIFSFGANDSAQNIPPQHTLAEAECLLRPAQAYARTLFIGPAPIADDAAADGRITSLCEDFTALAARLDLPYLPIHGFLRQHRSWMDEAGAGDGVHPGAGGYAALADFICGWAPWQGLFD